jgi:hypothetical protein
LPTVYDLPCSLGHALLPVECYRKGAFSFRIIPAILPRVFARLPWGINMIG